MTPWLRYSLQRRWFLASSPHEPVARAAESVTLLVRAGEDVIAHEVLCDNLSAYHVAAPRALLTTLRDAVMQVGEDPARVDLLL